MIDMGVCCDVCTHLCASHEVNSTLSGFLVSGERLWTEDGLLLYALTQKNTQKIVYMCACVPSPGFTQFLLEWVNIYTQGQFADQEEDCRRPYPYTGSSGIAYSLAVLYSKLSDEQFVGSPAPSFVLCLLPLLPGV